MRIFPSEDAFVGLAENRSYRVAPVMGEMLADTFTPIELVRLLSAQSRHVFLLESLEDKEHWGRYSFLGFSPKLEIRVKDGVVRINGEALPGNPNPNTVLRELLSEHRAPHMPDMPPFTGGLVGYFAFDYLRYSEPTAIADTEDAEDFADCDLMLFDEVIVFDHLRQKLLLVVNARLDEPRAGYREALERIATLKEMLGSSARRTPPAGRLLGPMTPLFNRARFTEMVQAAKHAIFEGDVFQLVLSNRFSAPFEGSLFNTYRQLRAINPSPYMFYLSGTDVEVAGASPETLVRLQAGTLHTFPLAGTRARGKTPSEDRALEAELLADEKELAEHNMLVDLGRNDLGRVSRFGTVRVEKLRAIERFSHVMHIGSTVRGEIRPECDALDAINAVLPAGTLSGAPKIRACQLIGEIEGVKRGIYGGALGYIDFSGNMDTAIAIRIAYRKGDRVFVRSGAGIVADSVPEKEYQECVNKARAVVTALEQAGELE